MYGAEDIVDMYRDYYCSRVVSVENGATLNCRCGVEVRYIVGVGEIYTIL